MSEEEFDLDTRLVGLWVKYLEVRLGDHLVGNFRLLPTILSFGEGCI